MLNSTRKILALKLATVRKTHDESGVALIAVILIVMMLLMTTLLVSMTVMSSTEQTKTFNIAQQSRATADSGMSSFLAAVNTSKGHTMMETYKAGSTVGDEQKVTPPAALCKTVEATVNERIGYFPRYCVWTVKVSSSTGTVGYYVYAKGFLVENQASTARSNPKDEVVIRVFTEPIVVGPNTTLDNGKVVYYMPASAPFQLGITGGTAVIVKDGAKIYSNEFARNSTPTGTDTSFVALASDTLINLPSDFVTGTLTAPASKSVAVICTPVGSSACEDPNHRVSPVSAAPDPIRAAVLDECPLPAESYPTWIASAETGTISQGCYNTVVIDRNMEIGGAHTARNPLEIFVKGEMRIHANSNVGKGRDPAAFQVRSIGSVTWTDDDATPNLTSQTHTNAYIASYSACNTTQTVRSLTVSGALACGTVTIDTNTTMFMDTKSQQYGVDITTGAPAGSVWFATGIEQL